MKRVVWIKIALSFIAFYSPILLSAQLIWDSYKIPSGLEIESIFQDSKAYFWLGDIGSVHRFDGLTWEVFSLGDSITSKVTSFSERSNGDLWVGLANGDIFFQQKNNWQKFDPEEGTPKKPITALLFDQKDRLWISTYGEGLYYYTRDRLYNIDPQDGLPSTDLYAAVLGPNGKIWCATDRGVGIVWLENGQKKIKQIGKKEGLSDEICTSLSASTGGTILLGLYDGSVAKFDVLEEKVQDIIPCSEYPIKQVLNDGLNYWILDQEGFLWRQRDQVLSQVEVPGLANMLFLSQDERMWLIDQKQRVFSAPLFLSHEVELAHPPQAISSDVHNNLWIGNTQGLFHFDPNTQKLSAVSKTKGLNISSLYTDRHQQIWLGTLGQGLWLYVPITLKLLPIPLSGITSKVPILSISGNQHSLWVATLGGAFLCELSTDAQVLYEQHFKEADGLGINYIYQSVIDSSGNTLLATDGQGLGRWKNGEMHLDKDLLGSSIFSISIDSSGGLWLLGDKGEVIYKKGNQCDTLLASKDQQALAIQAISSEEALLVYEKELFYLDIHSKQAIPLLTSSQFTGFGSHLNVLTLCKAGNIWLGSPKALLKIDPRKIPKNPGPQSSIKRVLINMQEAGEERHEFAHDEKHLTFEYAALWFVEPERISFRHRLKGYDLSWVESRNNRVIYADLTPGKYHFELEAGIDGFYQSDRGSKYSFEVKKPFWLRAIFLIPFCLAMLGLLYWVIQIREARITKNQELLRKSIEHQFETLKSQINPHFLFNAFSTLTGLVDESPDRAITYISRLSDLFRDILAYRDQPLITLEEELRILDNYHALQKERYGENFTLTVEVDKKLLFKKVPPLVLQILVENTLRHNIASKEHPLFINIFTENEHIIIQNPIQLRSSVPKSTKVGIQNIQDRYLLLTDSKIDIQKEPAVFTVKLPLLS